MLLDNFLTSYQVNEVHTISISTPPGCVYKAIRQFTPREVPLFGLLMGLRTLSARLAGRRFDSRSGERPLIERATEMGFILLAESPGREIVMGTIGQFWKLSPNGPPERINSPGGFVAFNLGGYAKAAFNFHIRPSRDGKRSQVRTETRIYLPDPQSESKFKLYWRIIGPGSALIRITWLRAIKKRAERECE
ncbi:MAG TPA: hypothetical protein VF952_05685 [Chloroflexia bacterium]